jgi:uncharacterized protein YndB with AHSA1/START domain
MAVKFEQHVEIDAAPEVVWSVLTDPRTWPVWFPDVERVANLGAVEQGAAFEWHKGNETGAGSITRLERQRQLRVVTSGDGPAVTHTFELSRAGGVLGVGGGDARLEYTMEYDPPGGFIMDLVAGGNPRDLLKVKGTLDKVKALAEGKTRSS